MAQQENSLAGCSKRPASKAAGESEPEAYPQGYVEDCDEPRTKLTDFFSILRNQIRLRNNTDKGGSVTASEWGMP
jgi:hypothetical protein